jgi:phenylacetate-CoA ligase
LVCPARERRRPDRCFPEVAKRHPELTRVRLVSRESQQDTMTLHVESLNRDASFANAIAESLQSVTKLKGAVMLVPPGSLPNDGKVIADERPVG